MHYIVNDWIVKSEYAAKSQKEPNQFVLDYISQLPIESCVLDYGCGKLRYAIPLAERVKQVVAVDSNEQLQLIYNSSINIASFNNLRIMSLDSPEWIDSRYDVVFCTNVLSAIPYESERIQLLNNAKAVLKPDGHLFLTVQYHNSYFSQYQYRKDTVKCNDGWLIQNKSLNRCSFYALLNADYLTTLCRSVGFNKINVKKKDGSCFLEAR